MTEFIYPLSQASEASRFGGKASGLQWLLARGVRSAPGLVIAVDAFAAHLDRSHASHALEVLQNTVGELASDAIEQECQRIQDLICSTPLSEAVMSSLRAAMQLLPVDHDNVKWIVRSSAVGEDGDTSSFAGQYLSVLDVSSSDASLQKAIAAVWASTLSSTVWRYGIQRKTPVNQMAVIVQQQVDAAFSGVLFTCDPSSANPNKIRVEYCSGLADALVSGEMTPVSIQLDRLTSLPSIHSPSKIDSASNRGPRDVETVVFDSKLDQQFQHTRHELVKTALLLEASAGKPLDIEWCVGKNEQVYVVQCRPITAGLPGPLEFWTNANIGENFPGPVVPMLSSFVSRGYAGYFRGLGKVLGVSSARLRASDDALQRLVGLQGGRLYYNLSQIVTVLHMMPGGAWLAHGFNVFTGTEGTPETKKVYWSPLSQLCQILAIVIRLPLRVWQLRAGLDRFEAMIDDYAIRSHPTVLTSSSMSDLANLLQEFVDIRVHRWTGAAQADAAAMVSYTALKELLERWVPESDQSQLQNSLLQGLPGLASTAPVEALWDLAEQARTDASALQLLESATPEAVWRCVSKQAPDFHVALLRYLDTWGFRYSGELMLTHPTPAENPLPIIQLLQTYLSDTGRGPIDRSRKSAEARIKSTVQIAAALTQSKVLRAAPLPSRANVFRIVLYATQHSIRLRERARMKQALLYTRLRHVCLALGHQLVIKEQLLDKDSIFFLTIDEAIVAARCSRFDEMSTHSNTPGEYTPCELDSSVSGDSLIALVKRRQSDFEYYQSVQPPDKFHLALDQEWIEDAGTKQTAVDTEHSMTGLSACAGTVTGQASVVLDVADIGTVAADTILVTRQTDPGWAPVFFLIKGLVVERGGMLSHGAIIAREYGIPAVVGVAEATIRIADGDRLHVDGSQGLVTWVE